MKKENQSLKDYFSDKVLYNLLRNFKRPETAFHLSDYIFGSYTLDRVEIPFLKDNNVKIEYLEPNPIIKDFLLKNNITLVDYKRGLVRYKNAKNTSKIGKYLPDDIKKYFINDLNRSDFITDKKIILTRDINDLILISTNRSWKGCTSIIRDSEGRIYIPNELVYSVDAGSVAAYLVDKDDLEIKHPHARVLINPYSIRSKSSKNTLGNNTIFFQTGKIYGNNMEMFKDSVVEFLKSKNKEIIKNGDYLVIGFAYTDDGSLENNIYYDKDIKKLLKYYNITRTAIDDKTKTINIKNFKLEKTFFYDLHGYKFKPTNGIAIVNNPINKIKDYIIPVDSIKIVYLHDIYTIENLEGLPKKIHHLILSDLINLKSLKGIEEVDILQISKHQLLESELRTGIPIKVNEIIIFDDIGDISLTTMDTLKKSLKKNHSKCNILVVNTDFIT